MDYGPGISLTNLSFGYGHNLTLKDIDLEVPRGTFAALLGPNGAGKSTLLKTISGYLKPQKGKVLVCEKPVHFLKDKERSRLVTYLAPESKSSFDFSVEEVVIMGRLSYSQSVFSHSPDDVDFAEKAMQITQIEHLRHRPVTSLSSGEQQRVQIARAICQDPQVFLLDEPTAHLDMLFELEIMELVTRLVQEGRTVFAILHDVNLALRFASRLYFMKDGVLTHSLEPNDLSSDVIREVYGVNARIVEDATSGARFVLPYAGNNVKPGSVQHICSIDTF